MLSRYYFQHEGRRFQFDNLEQAERCVHTFPLGTAKWVLDRRGPEMHRIVSAKGAAPATRPLG